MTGAEVVSFYAPGVPRPQGSKRAFVVNGRAVMTESSGRALKDWRAVVAHEAALAMDGRPPVEGPVSVLITFAFPRPKSHPKTTVTWPTGHPDIDKVSRGVLDALTQIVFRDDAQVVTITARKVWAPSTGTPGARVVVTSGAA